MESSCKTVLDMEAGAQEGSQVVLLAESRSRWKLGGLAAIVALCVSAAVLFTMHGQVSREGEQDRDLRHTLRQISQNAKDAIHLEGEYNPMFSNTSVEWHSEEGQAFAQGGLKLNEKNEITVSKNGLYFVYSQASFRVNCHRESGDNGEQFVHLSHMVMRWSDSYADWKPLLSSVRSACKTMETGHDNGEHWFNSIYLGAVFSLNRGDKLSTTSNKKLLAHVEGEDGKTFFGVFAL